MESKWIKAKEKQVKLFRAAGKPACKFGYLEKLLAGSSRHLNISNVWTTYIICAKMIWGFLPPGVLVALLRSWHAAPSRDETVLLASYQRPADRGHVSARLSVNNCSSLPFLLLLRHLLPVSHILHSWLSVLLVFSLLCNQTIAFSPLDCLSGFHFSLVLFFNNPLVLCLLFLALTETPQPGWLVQLMSDTATSSVSWMSGSKCWPTPKETTLTNHSTNTILSERDSKSL